MNKIDVIIFKNLIFLDQPFTYVSNRYIENGSFVIINFNNSLEIGLVLNCQPLEKENPKLKSVLKVIDELKALPDLYMKLGLWMRKFYVTSYAKAFSAICDFTKIDKVSYDYENLSGKSQIDEFIESIKFKKSDKDKVKLKSFIEDGLIKEFVSYKLIEPDYESYYGFNMTIDQALKTIRPNATRQLSLVLEIFDLLEGKETFSLSEIKRMDNYDKQVFEQLVKREIFIEIQEDKLEIKTKATKLSQEQNHIYNQIINSENNKFLIHGVTGSGKTEIYFKLIENSIEHGGGALFLVPEISLTPQMEDRIISRFGNKVAIIHSKLTKKQRITELNKIETGKAKILLGTRSAVFVPIENLKLIIIDEEHDSSYKLDENNKYDVREVARFLIENIEGSKLVLGSATPSVETYYKSQYDIYELLELKNRHKNIPMPKTKIVDLREEIKEANTSPFSNYLFDQMKNTLAKGKQILLFLNRRGFAPFVTCRDCGETIECDRCDISMVYHKSNNYLECHYCGQIKPLPRQCPNCSSKNIKTFGLGTQKLEEMTKTIFPNHNVLRIDSDTTKNLEDYKRNFKLIENRQVDIIIGTQMISKGFDFPDLDLVGVLAADLSLNIPEYYSGEETFQLLTQVSGRAGRSKDQGSVVIQSYNPDHYSIISAQNHDYKAFYKEEEQMRRTFNYPPFYRQYQLTIISSNYNENIKRSKEIHRNMERIFKESGINKYVDMLSNRDRLMTVKINNRYRTKIIFTSRIKYESQVKKSIYDLLFNNVYKMDLKGFHVDLIYR